ncbi:MAG: sulfite exporter TauE/SafE family protein [Chloroflexi bacterium]|nr:MAG: sulfite exporter TauE/SafE family protein [Chloroflexota bacterium]
MTTYAYWAAPLAVLGISFFFSMLGMGGGQLYIPVFYWLGLDFKAQAIPLGLLLNVVTSSSASSTYLRHRLVRLWTALPFAISMIIAAPIGALFTAYVPTKVIITLFAIFLLLAAGLALSGWKPTRVLTGWTEWVVSLAVGTTLGLLVGMLGRGGGSFVMPTLLVLGLDPKNAAATSSFIVTFSAMAGFLGHLAQGHVNWPLAGACALAALLGSQAGSRLMARRLRSRVLRRLFALVLIAVAIQLLWSTWR